MVPKWVSHRTIQDKQFGQPLCKPSLSSWCNSREIRCNILPKMYPRAGQEEQDVFLIARRGAKNSQRQGLSATRLLQWRNLQWSCSQRKCEHLNKIYGATQTQNLMLRLHKNMQTTLSARNVMYSWSLQIAWHLTNTHPSCDGPPCLPSRGVQKWTGDCMTN